MSMADESNGQKVTSLLRSHAGRAMAVFSANIEPQIAYAKKLPNIAESIMKQIKAPHWQVGDNRYVIRETNKKFFYYLDAQCFRCQTLGLDPWIASLNGHVEAVSLAVKRMDVTRIQRIGFMVGVHLPLEMSHSEMCDLMFGSYLVEREELCRPMGPWTTSCCNSMAITVELGARRLSPRRQRHNQGIRFSRR